MEVSAKDQDHVRNGIVSLKGIIQEWYENNWIPRNARDDAFLQLKRIDQVCNEPKTKTI
jgi:hypothetical protein